MCVYCVGNVLTTSTYIAVNALEILMTCIDGCCDLTFQAESGLISIIEHLHIIEVLMHANATIMFKDYRSSL